MQYYFTDELYHHGVKGMKWGVRRMKNKYYGSYTKAGIKRFNNSLEKYESKDKIYKDYKKSKGSTKQDVQKAKMDRKEAKYRLKADYKHLKQDKLADKGKMLYAGGKTITGNKAVTSTLATIGGLSLAAAAKLGPNRRIMLNTGKRMKAINPAAVLSAVGAATIAGATAKKAYDWDRNRKLRAYYGHTSNY